MHPTVVDNDARQDQEETRPDVHRIRKPAPRSARKLGGGVALAEFKGPQLQQYDKDKAGAVHMHYGRAFMVGVGAKDKKELRLLRLADGSLVDDGLFEVGRLCYE